MNYQNVYTSYLKNFLRPSPGIRVVFDSSNGATGPILKNLFKKTKVDYFALNSRPDGNFPAHGPDPLKKGAMRELCRKVLAHQADLGVIFDADGDRVFFLDNRGQFVSSDAIIKLIAPEFPPPYLVDVRAGWLIRKSSLPIIVSRVGHYFIKKRMAVKKIRFGGEFTGHYYFEWSFGNSPSKRKNIAYFDSGIRATICVLNAVSQMKKRGQKFSEWLNSLPHYYHSGEINFRIADKRSMIKRLEKIYRPRAQKINRLDGLTMEFNGFWFNVRLSNTESLLRLNLEANNRKILETELQKIKKLLESDSGVRITL